MAKPYKKPDLNAPRFRPKKLNFTNQEFHKKFIEDNPKFSSVTAEQFKSIITHFNGKIWQTVVDERDGVELPEQLGFLFIGTCPRKKNNVNFHGSSEHGVVLQFQNWESDSYIAKIFYTNYETKYRFKNHELWGFTGVRDFRRTVGKRYPQEWKKYLMVDDLIRVSRLFRKEKANHIKREETQLRIEYYDEFNLEEPWLDQQSETLSPEYVPKLKE